MSKNAGGDWPFVSVVLPARDAEETICDALDGALAQDYPGGLEIIVADGSDDDNTSGVIRERYPGVRLVPNPDRITSSGLNRAIESSRGEVIVRCDAHAVLPPGYVRRAMETMRRTGAAVVGGLQKPKGDSLFRRAVGIAMTTPLGAGDSRYKISGREGPTDMVYLGVFRAQSLMEVGGFDETIVRNEDYELNWRLRDRGETVWLDPSLAVSYWPRGSLGALARQYFDYGRWKSVVLRRHPRSLRWRQFAPQALVCALAASMACAAAGLWQISLVAPTAYLGLLLSGSIALGARRRDLSALLLPAVLATMHLSWGLGFFLPGRRPKRTASPQELQKTSLTVRYQTRPQSGDRASPACVPSYDYLLFVGPGRSATTYIYRVLVDYYAVSFPDIKEAHYYRSLPRYLGVLGRIPQESLLGDIANDAYRDPKLPRALERLRAEGVRVLVVVTLRDHIDRAKSMMQFDISRGRALWFGGRAGLEARVVGRRLTAGNLRDIYSAGTDVAVLDFDILTLRPKDALNRLAAACGIAASCAEFPSAKSNESKRSRSVLLTAAAVLLAKALRAAGFRRALQRLKDSRRVHGWFFRPLQKRDGEWSGSALSAEHVEILSRDNRDCWKLVRRRSTSVADGLCLTDAKPSSGTSA